MIIAKTEKTLLPEAYIVVEKNIIISVQKEANIVIKVNIFWSEFFTYQILLQKKKSSPISVTVKCREYKTYKELYI
ncbi:hypothetical protein CEJ87_13435 [Caldifermentibacillus hisashii]|nr:hypothetical protein CEJ87_13435 [Caldifermentibacillus hisashii]